MKFCPQCGEDLTKYGTVPAKPAPEPEGPYDQTKMWRDLCKLAASRSSDPPTAKQLVDTEMALMPRGDVWPRKSLIHLVFDRSVTPQGGILQLAALSEGRLPIDADRLRSMGYLFNEHGKVEMVDNNPIGYGYRVLKDWAMNYAGTTLESIRVEPARKGDPFFMDDQLIAFGATWATREGIEVALLKLLEDFSHVSGLGNAVPLVLRIVWQ